MYYHQLRTLFNIKIKVVRNKWNQSTWFVGCIFFTVFFNMHLFKTEWNFIVNTKAGELLVQTYDIGFNQPGMTCLNIDWIVY